MSRRWKITTVSVFSLVLAIAYVAVWMRVTLQAQGDLWKIQEGLGRTLHSGMAERSEVNGNKLTFPPTQEVKFDTLRYDDELVYTATPGTPMTTVNGNLIVAKCILRFRSPWWYVDALGFKRKSEVILFGNGRAEIR